MKCARQCKPAPNRVPTVRVELLRFDSSVSANNHGEKDRNDPANYLSLGSRWAAWKTRAGSERFASEQMQAGHSHRLYLRYDALTKALTPEDRIKNGTKTYGIDAVSDEDEQHRWMVVDVTETK